jgi:hypothetical protein
VTPLTLLGVETAMKIEEECIEYLMLKGWNYGSLPQTKDDYCAVDSHFDVKF